MPDYKKKCVRRIRPAKKIKKNTALSDDIVMSPSGRSKPAREQSEIRIVKGNKLERSRYLKLWVSFCTGLVLILVVLSLTLPVGILENIGNLSASFGAGEYPLKLDGSETLNSIQRTGYYYILTDTHINTVSNSGKLIYSKPHGYERPVLKTSATRAMVFEQGGRSAVIYNLSGQVSSINTEMPIITANISRSGAYSVVTESASYAATVSVYDKKDNLIYEWNSSEDMVNNVVVSPNGKKIAVSLLNSSGGKYLAKVYVLKFDSATPVFREEYTDTVVYALDSTLNSGFSVVTEKHHRFFTWSDYEKSEYNNEYETSVFRAGSDGILVVYNRPSNRTDNRVVIFSKVGKKKSEFDFNGIISDIFLYNGHIYCISDTQLLMLDSGGNIIRKAECGFGSVRLAVLGTYSAAVITDNQIVCIKLKPEGEA